MFWQWKDRKEENEVRNESRKKENMQGISQKDTICIPHFLAREMVLSHNICWTLSLVYQRVRMLPR